MRLSTAIRARRHDRERGHTNRARLKRRALDAIPGTLAWLTLGLLTAGAAAAPALTLGAAALLAGYSALRFFLAGIATLRGLRNVQQWEATDWQVEYARRAAGDSLPLDAVCHLVLIPNYNENVGVLRRTLDRLAGQVNASRVMTVVLAMEAAESGAAAKGRALQAEYAGAFARVIVSVHPRDIPGEQACKSANLAWAIRHAAHTIDADPDHVVVTVMDADTLWHPRYFESVSVLFATDPQRYRTYWQAPIRYHGNVWAANPLLRILHAYASTWELAYLAAPWWFSLPMSSYSLSLRLLERGDCWDPDAIADEWHMYIKSFFRLDGDQHLRPVFLPFLATTSPARSLRAAITDRYRQTFRHAWGAKEIGYTLENAVRRRTGLRATALLWRVAHDNLLAGAGWIVIVLGSQLPLLLHPAWARAHLTAPALILLQSALAVVTGLTILFWALDVRLRPPRPAPWTWRERLSEAASLPLIAVLTMICVALPVLHAQTWLMLGRPIRFRVTAKS